MPKPLFLLTRWNAYDPIDEINAFLKETIAQRAENVHIGIALPYHYIKELSSRFADPRIRFGALSMASVEEGAFTREIAGKFLKQAPASFVLIGSDFERQVLKTDGSIFRHKIAEALKAEVTPILCVGVSAQEHQDGKGSAVLQDQLKEALEGFNDEQLAKISVFFESPWMRRLPFKPTVEEVIASYIEDQKILESVVGKDAADQMQIILTAPDDLQGQLPDGVKGFCLSPRHSHGLLSMLTAAEEEKKRQAAERPVPPLPASAPVKTVGLGIAQPFPVKAEESLQEIPIEDVEAPAAEVFVAVPEEAAPSEEAPVTSPAQDKITASELEESLRETTSSEGVLDIDVEAMGTASEELIIPEELPELRPAGKVKTNNLEAQEPPPVLGAGKVRKDHKVSDLNK